MRFTANKYDLARFSLIKSVIFRCIRLYHIKKKGTYGRDVHRQCPEFSSQTWDIMWRGLTSWFCHPLNGSMVLRWSLIRSSRMSQNGRCSWPTETFMKRSSSWIAHLPGNETEAADLSGGAFGTAWRRPSFRYSKTFHSQNLLQSSSSSQAFDFLKKMVRGKIHSQQQRKVDKGVHRTRETN